MMRPGQSEIPASRRTSTYRTRSTSASISPEVVSRLSAVAIPVTHPKGAMLFGEGQPAGGIYILISGRVKLFTAATDGKTFIIKFADPGTILGLAPTVSGLPYEAWAQATEPTRTGFVERKGLVHAMQSHHEVAVEVAMQLGESYCSAIAEMRVMGLARPASQKLAIFLLDWFEGYRPFGATAGEGFGLTHEEIAQLLGISRETVTRLLLVFRREGLIEWTDGKLVLADRAALESSAAK